MAVQMIDKNVLALPGARAAVALLALASLVDACGAVGQAWALASAIVGLWRGEGLGPQLGWVAAFAGCFALRQVLACVRSGRIDRYARERAAELRLRLAERIYRGGPSFVAACGTGDAVTVLVEGVDRVRSYVALILPKLTDLAVMPLVLLAALFALDWVSGLIALTALPCMVFYMRLLGASAKEAAARQHGDYRRMANHFIDTLRGVETLKLFGRGAQQEERVYRVSERFREATVKTLRTATLSSLVLDLWGTFALAAVAIMLGFRLMDGSVAFLPSLAALILVPDFFGAVRRFAADFHATLDGKNSLASIRAMLGEGDGDQEPPATEAGQSPAAEKPSAPPCVVQAVAGGSGRPADERVSAASWGPASSLVLTGVGYAYPGEGAPALSGVDLAVRGCTRVGVVGASGAGKSTLARLVAGLADPACGVCEVDGRELASLRCDLWRRQVAYIPQDPHIFSGTLRDNLAFYRPDAPDGDVRCAVEAVGLAEAVGRLPRGLLTPVGEGGRRLSGGEAQRVALARAFLDDRRRVLVFDEPTAHLDIETELALKERALPLMEGRLVFFATHRLHWMNEMDLVVVLEGGRVVQAGTPADLLAQDGGAFVRLAARQRMGV